MVTDLPNILPVCLHQSGNIGAHYLHYLMFYASGQLKYKKDKHL